MPDYQCPPLRGLGADSSSSRPAICFISDLRNLKQLMSGLGASGFHSMGPYGITSLETYGFPMEVNTTQIATGNNFDPGLGPCLQFVLKKVTSLPGYPEKTYPVAFSAGWRIHSLKCRLGEPPPPLFENRVEADTGVGCRLGTRIWQIMSIGSRLFRAARSCTRV